MSCCSCSSINSAYTSGYTPPINTNPYGSYPTQYSSLQYLQQQLNQLVQAVQLLQTQISQALSGQAQLSFPAPQSYPQTTYAAPVYKESAPVIQQQPAQAVVSSASYPAPKNVPAQAPAVVPQPVPQTIPGRPPLGNLTPDVFNDPSKMSQSEKASACGPTAALAFTRYLGLPTTLDESLRVARDNGYWDFGMKGPDTEVALLNKLGVKSVKEGVDWEKVKREVKAGKPVIIDTPKHYWVVEGYNEQTGEFNMAASATYAAAKGKKWYKPNEIDQFSGAARSMIYLAQ